MSMWPSGLCCSFEFLHTGFRCACRFLATFAVQVSNLGHASTNEMEATRMKLMTVLSATVLAVLLGISAPVFGQDESHPQEDKRAEPDAKAAQQDKQEDKQVDKDKQIDKDKAEKQQQEDKDKRVQEDKSIAHQDAKQSRRA